MKFDYELAFSRNIGWLTKEEQFSLKNKTVGIAGLGGVGGAHLLTLVRLGIEKFHIADLDKFEVENFNRQMGANMKTIEREKVDVLAEMALDINPNIQIKKFSQGINKSNMTEFLTGVDIYVDGLDFFCFETRREVFKQCYKLAIPAITAGPIGMGSVLLNFLPGKMNFDDYFGIQTEKDVFEKSLLFGIGLTPKIKQAKYLIDKSQMDLKNKKGPSTIMACNLCAGVAATEVLKILLKRGKVYCAPHSFHTDAYFNKVFHSWIPWGYKNPLQRIRMLIARRLLKI